MNKKPLFTIFCTNFLILIVGYGVFPLLPGYAMQFGADTGDIGLFLGLIYVAISAGSMLPSWLPATVSRKWTFVLGTAVCIPAIFLLGHATAFWQVVVLTALVWFGGGVGLALGSLFTGLLSAQGKRGTAFTLVTLSLPAASLTGGLSVGWLVQQQGYPFTFTALSVMLLALPALGYFKLGDIAEAADSRRVVSKAEAMPSGNRAFILLMVAALGVAGAVSVGRMGVSLVMEQFLFSPTAISSTTAVAGVALIPYMLLSGVLADRVGTRRLLIGGYVLAGLGVLVLITAVSLWQFSLAITLLMVGRAASDALAPAVATDMLPKAALGRALPRLKATNWLGGIVSFIGGGYAMDAFGVTPVLVLSGGVAIASALLLLVTNVRQVRLGRQIALAAVPPAVCPE